MALFKEYEELKNMLSTKTVVYTHFYFYLDLEITYEKEEIILVNQSECANSTYKPKKSSSTYHWYKTSDNNYQLYSELWL